MSVVGSGFRMGCGGSGVGPWEWGGEWGGSWDLLTWHTLVLHLDVVAVLAAGVEEDLGDGHVTLGVAHTAVEDGLEEAGHAERTLGVRHVVARLAVLGKLLEAVDGRQHVDDGGGRAGQEQLVLQALVGRVLLHQAHHLLVARRRCNNTGGGGVRYTGS